MTGWAGYLSGQVATAEIDERAAEATLDTAEAVALVRSREDADAKALATILKAQRDLDPAVVEMRQEVANRYAYRKLVGVLFTNVERDAALVSRELTRRTGSYEAKPRRESRWRP